MDVVRHAVDQEGLAACEPVVDHGGDIHNGDVRGRQLPAQLRAGVMDMTGAGVCRIRGLDHSDDLAVGTGIGVIDDTASRMRPVDYPVFTRRKQGADEVDSMARD